MAAVWMPETHYAKTPDGQHIAYQVLGDGPVDFVYIGPWVTHLEYRWELPEYASYLEGLASFSRLILFDRRGMGLSDPLPPEVRPDLEGQIDDVQAVMDAVGSERAVIYGASESSTLAMLFAAMHPERTVALVVHGAYPSGTWEPDAPWGYRADEWEERVAEIDRSWGTEGFVRREFPGWADADLIRWWATYLRRSISPGAVITWERLDIETDVRPVLSAIHVPTLIMHREDDLPEAGAYLAEHIAGAEHITQPGREHVPYVGDQGSVVRDIQRFVAGVRRDEATLNRKLATVLFTDIVDSTAQAAATDHVRWREIADEHDRTIHGFVRRFQGRVVKTMGDGFLAIFDGPARGIRCALGCTEAVERLGIQIRTGLHTGEVEELGDDVGGVGVAIGARVGALAGPSEVLVSQTVKDLVVGAGFVFDDAGEHELKGVPDRWRLYRVVA
jgi:class 3 adenylate cyclase/pimeloyl-ACP methyl ester carboxylesterase